MKKTTEKRRVCFVITSFIHYSRNLLILDELRKRKDIDLHIVIGGTALLSKYSSRYAQVRSLLEADGHKNLYEIYFNLEGDKDVVKAKTAGLGIVEFANMFNNIKPDIVVVRGDRFEVLSAATAAAYMHIPIAHIEGGDITGTLDESVRHSITKLAHVHFPTNRQAEKRLLRMGEHKEYVFNFGSPDIEVAHILANGDMADLDIGNTGSGATINLDQDYLMVSFHPVTTELTMLPEYTRTLLEVIYELEIPTFWFWPNFDAGSEEKISHELRVFNDNVKDHNIRFLRYIPPRDFLCLLKNTRCLIGNSSAGIKESSYLGVPVVNVGSRQRGRLHGNNVLHVPYAKNAIARAIQKQLKQKKYSPSHIYKGENTAQSIAKTLAKVKLYTQKSFSD